MHPKQIRQAKGRSACRSSSLASKLAGIWRQMLVQWPPKRSVIAESTASFRRVALRKSSGGRFQTQELIDAACKEVKSRTSVLSLVREVCKVVKPSPLVPRARCCTMSPKQIRLSAATAVLLCSVPLCSAQATMMATISTGLGTESRVQEHISAENRSYRCWCSGPAGDLHR